VESNIEHQTFVTLKMTEEEARWLRNRMQNYIEPMRPATEPPIPESPEDQLVRGRFFNALQRLG
jgi:hypothetical protein